MITPEQLQQHATWLNNDGGQRIEQVNADLSEADLSGANLSEADLSGANLSGSVGNMREIKSAQFDSWSITWSADVLAIGCQQHAIEKWRNADPRWIAAMDLNASNWWSCYGALVLQLIDASPATGVVLEVIYG